MYRVLRNLSTGHKVGDLVLRGELKEEVIEPLKRVRAISDVNAPPINSLPGWKEKAKTLEKYGITGADEFYEAGDNVLRFIFRESPETIKVWKEEVLSFLR